MSKGTLKIPGLETFLIPIKKTKDFDWIKELHAYLTKMDEDPFPLESDINQFHRMRQDCRGAPLSLVGASIVATYYRQLDSLSKRLPLAETPLEHSFTWYDSFDDYQSSSQSSVAFEKANMLYLLGTLFSSVEDRAELAAKNYQMAASIFSYTAENFLHAPLLDISRPTLNFFSTLMLAQAQEAAVQAASLDKSLGTLSKLSSAVAKMYVELQDRLDSPSLETFKASVFAFDKELGDLIPLKASLWKGITLYYTAMVLYENGKAGESIANLMAAETEIGQTLQRRQKNFAKIVAFATNAQSEVRAKIASYEKENSLIYNQVVPPLSSLDLPEDVVLVKIIPISECWKSVREPSTQLFSRLIPLKMHEELSKYSEEKSKLLRYESLKLNGAESEFQTTLTSLGFPAALERVVDCLKETESLPADFVTLGSQARALDVQSLQSNIGDILSKISSTLMEGSSDLDDEIAAFQKARLDHGDYWNQRPSRDENSAYFTELAMLQGRLKRISLVDGTAADAVDPKHRLLYSQLVGPEKDFQKVVPRLDSAARAEVQQKVKNVQSQLYTLEKQGRDRATCLDRLKQAILSDDIADKIAEIKSVDSKEFIEQELAKFDELCQKIEDGVKQQDEALKSFIVDWKTIQELIRPVETDRSNFLSDLRRALAAYSDLARRYREVEVDAKNLHNDSQALLGRVKSFVRARADERLQIERRLSSQSAELGQRYLMTKLNALKLASKPKSGESDKRPPPHEGSVPAATPGKAAPLEKPHPTMPAPAPLQQDNGYQSSLLD